MRVVVTRPQPDGERTAEALRARGHAVLLAPLMRVEPIDGDLAGHWGGVVITSANAPAAIAGNPARAALIARPVFAVGGRSADAARQAGFDNVTAAGGNARALVQLIAERHADAKAPLLYLAGEDRAADLIGDLAKRGIAAEMRVVYRAVTVPFPPGLITAFKSGTVDGALHFSARSAENFVAAARQADITATALGVWHYCLAAQIAAPLAVAGAKRLVISPRSDESALIELLASSPA